MFDALISVYDKSNLESLTRKFEEKNINIVSTGGTFKYLQDLNIKNIKPVESLTNAPEILGGRVKTLHPDIYAGILYRNEDDEVELSLKNITLYDIVVVNLYPFGTTQSVENIDIGGVSLLRAAAKNYENIITICDINDYQLIIDYLDGKAKIDLNKRKELAVKAFRYVTLYDSLITSWLSDNQDSIILPLSKVETLRYGENSHQSSTLYQNLLDIDLNTTFKSLDKGKKQLGHNNILDINAALNIALSYDEPTIAIVKHNNPCGVASNNSLVEAYRLALEGDPESAFGGIVASNKMIDSPTAELINQVFTECVVAPSFSDDALRILQKKKNVRILSVSIDQYKHYLSNTKDIRQVAGGFLIQDRDISTHNESDLFKCVTSRTPTPDELKSLLFAWKACQYVKSNAIVLARGTQVVGVGAGQMSRVKSVEIACSRAKDRAKGSVLASDGFFPFSDGLELAIEHGVTAVIQPGGSINDQNVIDTANKHGIAMIFVGRRHFLH